LFNLKQSEKKVQYDEDMRPLSDILQVVVKYRISAFSIIVSKYNSDFLNEPAQLEFGIFLKMVLEDTRKMISPKYKDDVLDRYFTEYGLVIIMYDALKTLFMVEYETISKSF